jgi:hypothetical protein
MPLADFGGHSEKQLVYKLLEQQTIVEIAKQNWRNNNSKLYVNSNKKISKTILNMEDIINKQIALNQTTQKTSLSFVDGKEYLIYYERRAITKGLLRKLSRQNSKWVNTFFDYKKSVIEEHNSVLIKNTPHLCGRELKGAEAMYELGKLNTLHANIERKLLRIK